MFYGEQVCKIYKKIDLFYYMSMYVLIFSCFLLVTSCNYKKDYQGVSRFYSLRPADRSAAMPDSVLVYLNEALDTIYKYSIHTDSMNWPFYREGIYKKAMGAQIYAQTYYAIEEALKGLGDNHSFLKSPDEHQKWSNVSTKDTILFKSVDGVMLSNKIARIYVPRFFSGDPALSLQYANDLQRVIRDLDSKNPIGWIIRLEYNFGGNMWPMLAGVGPLLNSEGVQGGFLAKDGNITPWAYDSGIVKMGDEEMLRVTNPYKVKDKSVPIAVTINGRTASSAEAILISFIGQPNTKIFGTPTAGLSTANGSYGLRDGAQLILTSAVFTDRKGVVYGKKIKPDVYLVNGLSTIFTRRTKEAEKWILTNYHKNR